MNRPFSPQLLQRLFALAGLALVLTVGALAVSRRTDDDAGALPEAAPAPDGGWYDALAAPEPNLEALRADKCGFRVREDTVGVAHPVLPCGAQVYLSFGDRQVLTRVIGRGPATTRSEFAVTKQLARRIGLEGVQRIKWRFAATQS